MSIRSVQRFGAGAAAGTTRRPGILCLTAASAAFMLASCSSGPATRDQVCSSFTDLSNQWMEGNGLFTNPMFRQARTTGGIAKRYREDAGVQSDGATLVTLGKADTMNGMQLMNGTQHIANLCGHPFGIGG